MSYMPKAYVDSVGGGGGAVYGSGEIDFGAFPGSSYAELAVSARDHLPCSERHAQAGRPRHPRPLRSVRPDGHAQGIVIRNRTVWPAAGTGIVVVQFDWAEVTAY